MLESSRITHFSSGPDSSHSIMKNLSSNSTKPKNNSQNSITFSYTCYRCVVEVVVEHDVEAEPEGQDEKDVPQQEEEERRQHLNGIHPRSYIF